MYAHPHKYTHMYVLSVTNFTLDAHKFYRFLFIFGAWSAGNTQKNSPQVDARLESKLLSRY